MKYFLFFFLIITIGHSQTGKITYNSTFSFGGSNFHQTKNDLYFTNSASYYQSQLNVDKKTESDEKATEDSKTSKSVEINITVGSDSIGDVYYRNLKKSKIICRAAAYENKKTKYYIYEDDVNIKWQLEDEFKDISGYNSQKASARFRGRNYEAWFTSEIPLSFGPWKFGGLPGLILEIYDQTGEIYISVEHIQIPYEDANKKVNKPTSESIITHQEFIEKNDSNISKITQAILARSPKGSKIVSTKVEKNGIELEYEWEKE